MAGIFALSTYIFLLLLVVFGLIRNPLGLGVGLALIPFALVAFLMALVSTYVGQMYYGTTWDDMAKLIATKLRKSNNQNKPRTK